MTQLQKKLTNYPKNLGLIGDNPTFEKNFPQAPEIEKAVLGAILLERGSLMTVSDFIKRSFFYEESHQIIFEAIISINERGESIDLLTVTNELRKSGVLEKSGGIQYISRLTTNVNSAAHLEAHCRILNELAIRREVIRTSDELLKDAYEGREDVFEVLDKAQQSLFQIATETTKKKSLDSKEVVKKLLFSLTKRMESHLDGSLIGVPSGLLELDRITSGFQKSELIILAARPGMGKTSMCLEILLNACLIHQKRVPIFSLEMSVEQLGNRMLSSYADISAKKLKDGDINQEEYELIITKSRELESANFYINDDSAISIEQIRTECRRLQVNGGIDMVIVDYLQLIQCSSKQGNREQEIAHISRSLKGLAKELNIPVIALSQLSRAVETRGGDKRPMLSDLRESGAVEQDADIVMFLYRPEYYGITEDANGNSTIGLCEVIVAKNRSGVVDSAFVGFDGSKTKFYNW